MYLLSVILFKATGGIEPPNKGFADPCLTTWLRGPTLSYVLANTEACLQAHAFPGQR